MAVSKSLCLSLLLLGLTALVQIQGKTIASAEAQEQQQTTTTEPEPESQTELMDLAVENDEEKSEKNPNWTQTLNLNKNGDFTLKVSTEDENYIVFEMSGPGKGYVSVGFSPDGGMNNSDIVMGWIDADGKAQLKDLHGVGNTKPKEDAQQNYELISGEQTDSATTIQFRRRYANCDAANDRALEAGEYKIIWAFNQEDPKLAEEDGSFKPPYHFTNRGAHDATIELPKGDLSKSCD